MQNIDFAFAANSFKKGKEERQKKVGEKKTKYCEFFFLIKVNSRGLFLFKRDGNQQKH